MSARLWWLKILATQEAEIKTISVPSLLRQIVCKTKSQKKKKKSLMGTSQDVEPEFEHQ
jgi:hypothetical protein